MRKKRGEGRVDQVPFYSLEPHKLAELNGGRRDLCWNDGGESEVSLLGV